MVNNIASILWIIAFVMYTYKNPKKMFINFILGSIVTFFVIFILLKIIGNFINTNMPNGFDLHLLFASSGLYCALYLIYNYSLKRKTNNKNLN